MRIDDGAMSRVDRADGFSRYAKGIVAFEIRDEVSP